MLVRAQIAIATILGVVMLRTSAVADPIASADSDSLADPLRQVFELLLLDSNSESKPED